MLAICQALMGNSALVVIDQPAEGLAPLIASRSSRQNEDISNNWNCLII